MDTTRMLPRLPINKPPYGTLVAIDLKTGARRWEVPLGTLDITFYRDDVQVRGGDAVVGQQAEDGEEQDEVD